MWPDRVSNPGPLTFESGALPTVLCGLSFVINLSACLYKSTKSYCCHFKVDVGVGITLLSFKSKFKALSGKLSCSWTGLVFVFTFVQILLHLFKGSCFPSAHYSICQSVRLNNLEVASATRSTIFNPITLR